MSNSTTNKGSFGHEVMAATTILRGLVFVNFLISFSADNLRSVSSSLMGSVVRIFLGAHIYTGMKAVIYDYIANPSVSSFFLFCFGISTFRCLSLNIGLRFDNSLV